MLKRHCNQGGCRSGIFLVDLCMWFERSIGQSIQECMFPTHHATPPRSRCSHQKQCLPDPYCSHLFKLLDWFVKTLTICQNASLSPLQCDGRGSSGSSSPGHLSYERRVRTLCSVEAIESRLEAITTSSKKLLGSASRPSQPAKAAGPPSPTRGFRAPASRVDESGRVKAGGIW